MNKEIKRQLILAVILLFFLVSTLFLWYSNFIFHTYINVVDYQYCFYGENDTFIVDGYEFYKNELGVKHGKARIIPLAENVVLKDDVIQITFELTSSNQQKYSFKQKVKVKTDNAVCFMDEQDTEEMLSTQDFLKASLKIEVIRNEKNVYEQNIDMNEQPLVVYNGGNKDYTIQSVYVTSSWLKTGLFSSTKKGIEKEYPTITIDYLYLKDEGNKDDINDYERFAYVKGATRDMLDGKIQEVAYYDNEGSLLDKELCCVVTLIKDETTQDVYTFMINLHGAVKAVKAYE